eukprot:Gb_07582 [translate_table: standard]
MAVTVPACTYSRHFRHSIVYIRPPAQIPTSRVKFDFKKINLSSGRVSTCPSSVYIRFGWRHGFLHTKIDNFRLSRPNAVSEASANEKEQDLDTESPAATSNTGSNDDSRARQSVSSESSAETNVTSRKGDSTSSPQQSKRWFRKREWNLNWNWNWNMQGREFGALMLQLLLVFFLMRFLRPGVPVPRPGSSQTLASDVHVFTTYVSVPFSEFLSRINNNHVQKVEVDGEHFTFYLKPSVSLVKPTGEIENDGQMPMARWASPTKRIVFTTTRPSDMKTPYERMLENQVEFGAPDKRSGSFLNSALLALLYIALVAGLFNQFPMKFLKNSTGFLRNQKGRFSGNRKAGDRQGSVMFVDVAGVDEAKEELEEIVEYLRCPDRYARLGARPPRGVLLVGPPGTGKTLLAKAVAGEADVPFISSSASEFVELYVGMGASRVRDIFARAKKDAPSIIFIDEIDAVAKGRDGRLRTINNDEREQTLNQLLTEMDGFESNSTVIVLGATNRADVLDHALRRPGRFDRIVMVEPPDRHGREAILQVHITKKELPLAADVDLNVIATATTGFTGADLANLVNEAALLAGRADKLVVGKEEFLQAVERSVAGIEKKRSSLQSREKAVVARHEAGHAVVGTAVAHLLPGHPQVEKLSILPRSGGALGFTYTPPAGEDRHLLFVDELRGRLVTLLGGRAAEEVVYSGRVSTGALDDIKRATDMAYKAIAEYGLNQSVGPISLATLSRGGLDESGSTIPWAKDQGHVVDLVQNEVKSLLQSALATALIVIRSNPTVLEGLGAQLEENEKVEGEVLQKWLKLVVAPVELAAFIKGEYMLAEKNDMFQGRADDILPQKSF